MFRRSFNTQKSCRTGFPIRRQTVYLPNKSLCDPMRPASHIILDTVVNGQSVRQDVAFPMAHPIAGQIVIAVLFQQRSPIASSATTCSSNSIFRPRLIARL